MPDTPGFPLETGNAHDAPTQGTGWFIGFGDWTRGADGESLLHVPREQDVRGLCMKFMAHAAGDVGENKPISEGRTLSMLASEGSVFELDFWTGPEGPGPVRTVRLARHGDFAAWGEGLYHRWRCVTACTILTLRWSPVAGPGAPPP